MIVDLPFANPEVSLTDAFWALGAGGGSRRLQPAQIANLRLRASDRVALETARQAKPPVGYPRNPRMGLGYSVGACCGVGLVCLA